jgi:S-(hydroxymethyl)glutathione dehydrogenase/alcohol dehydrogenase
VSERLEARALVLERLGEQPRLERIDVAPPGPGEVRLAMRAAGLCHTDLTQVRDARFTPILLGHEGVGEVESVGEGVEGLAPGDRVLVCWRVPCGRCVYCASGREHLCQSTLALREPRYFRNGEPLRPMLDAGCFCDYVVLPAEAAIPIAVDLPLEQAALVGCAVATGVGAVLWTARVRAGESVAVFGAGGVGLNVVVGARMAGAGSVVAVDPDPKRRELARARGADALSPQDEIGRFDHVFEVVGDPTVMEAAVGALGPGGQLVLVGAAARDATMSFHPRRFLSQQQRLVGCIYGSIGDPHAQLPALLRWCADGTIPLADLIGRRITFAELEQAFGEPDRDGVRTLVTFP